MTLSITQRILCELHTVGAMNEQTGLSGKDIADLLDTKQAPARLVELRKSGYVKSSDRSTGTMRFWLTPAGETYAIELKHYAGESKQDQSTDANCDQANNTSENSELADVDDTNVADSQANSDANWFQYPIYKKWVAGGLIVKFTELTKGEVIEAGASYYQVGYIATFSAHTCKEWQDWTPPEAETVAIPEGFTPWHGGECPVPSNARIDAVFEDGHANSNSKVLVFNWKHGDDINNLIAYRLSEQPTAETLAVPESENPYNPDYEMMGCALIDDVVANNVEAFNRLDDVAEKREIPPPQYHQEEVAFRKHRQFYTFDDANETWETLTDAIAAARDYVEKHGHMVMVFTTRNIAAVSPIVASQVEYL